MKPLSFLTVCVLVGVGFVLNSIESRQAQQTSEIRVLIDEPIFQGNYKIDSDGDVARNVFGTVDSPKEKEVLPHLTEEEIRQPPRNIVKEQIAVEAKVKDEFLDPDTPWQDALSSGVNHEGEFLDPDAPWQGNSPPKVKRVGEFLNPDSFSSDILSTTEKHVGEFFDPDAFWQNEELRTENHISEYIDPDGV